MPADISPLVSFPIAAPFNAKRASRKCLKIGVQSSMPKSGKRVTAGRACKVVGGQAAAACISESSITFHQTGVCWKALKPVPYVGFLFRCYSDPDESIVSSISKVSARVTSLGTMNQASFSVLYTHGKDSCWIVILRLLTSVALCSDIIPVSASRQTVMRPKC